MSDYPPPPPPGETPEPNPYGVPSYGQPQYGQSQPGQPAPGVSAPGAQPAGLLDRFLARLIDGLLVGVVTIIVGVILDVLFNGALRVAVTAIITTAVSLAYFTLLESSRGQTLGKMALKLKVVGPTGSHPTQEQALKRNLWLALGILSIFGVAGSRIGSLLELIVVIVIAVGISRDTARRQHFFDHFAGETQVEKLT